MERKIDATSWGPEQASTQREAGDSNPCSSPAASPGVSWQGKGAGLTHLQLRDDAVLVVLVLDGGGHDRRGGGRAGHLGHGPAQLHLGLLHLQLLGLGLLQVPGLSRPGSAPPPASAPLLGSAGSRPAPACPPGSLSSQGGLFPWGESPLASFLLPPTSSERGDHREGLWGSLQASLSLNLLSPCPRWGGTLMKVESFLLVTTTSPVRVVVRPWEEGKLRRGGGGGGDLEGFSVRYRGTVSSSAAAKGLEVRGPCHPDSKGRGLASSSKQEGKGHGPLLLLSQLPLQSSPQPRHPSSLHTQRGVQGPAAAEHRGACQKCRSSGPTPSRWVRSQSRADPRGTSGAHWS